MRTRVAFWALIVSLAMWACEAEMVEKEINQDPDDIENPDNEVEIDTFYVVIDTVFNNSKCVESEEDFGEFKARIFDKHGLEIEDYNAYQFQWYTGLDLSHPIAAEDSARIMNLSEGDYTLLVTDTIGRTAKLSATIDSEFRPISGATVTELSPQTVASPPNGQLEVRVTGGNYGYTFQWENAVGPMEGEASSILSGVPAGTYTVRVTTPGGCFDFFDGIISNLSN